MNNLCVISLGLFFTTCYSVFCHYSFFTVKYMVIVESLFVMPCYSIFSIRSSGSMDCTVGNHSILCDLGLIPVLGVSWLELFPLALRIFL